MFLLLLAGIAAGEPDAVDLTRRMTENTKETVAVLKAVVDRPTAEKAKPRLEDLSARYERFRKDLADRTDAERDDVPRSVLDERKKQDEALTLAHDEVFARHKDAYRVLAGTGVFKRVEEALESKAKLQLQVIEQACKNYCILHEGDWPAALNDLTQKMGDKPPLLEGGRKAVTDPWGAPIRFEVVTDAFGSERVRVWTLSPYGDGKKVLEWPQRPKK